MSKLNLSYQFKRLFFWMKNPVGFMKRFYDIFIFKNKNSNKEKYLDEIHKQYTSISSVPLIKLGTEYGGWWTPEKLIESDSLIISAGAGEDISFDVELAKKYKKMSILITDPTPRAFEHYKSTLSLLKNNHPAPINNSDSEFYNVESEDLNNIEFRQWGIWKKNTQMRFYMPENPEHVSHSINNLQKTEKYFIAQCFTLQEILSKKNKKYLSILKLDIEGAEFDVLENMMETNIFPKYIMVEFHSGDDVLENEYRTKTLETIKKLYSYGYRIIKRCDWDYVLERQVS